MDLVRGLLLKLEALDLSPGAVGVVSPYGAELAIDGYSSDEIGHHLQMLVSGNLVETGGSRPFSGDGSLIFRGLSWQGHEFLDEIRDPERWKKTKAGADAVKSWSIDTFKDIAKGLVKKQIEEWSGVKL